MDLSELNLDIRAFNAVCRAGFKTAEELFQAIGENQESVRLLVGRSNFDRIDEAFAELEDKGMLEFTTKLPPAPAEATTPEYLEAFNLNARIHYGMELAEQGISVMCIGIEQMHSGKQYKKLGYANFEEYCQNEFGFSRIQGRKYVDIGMMLKGQNDKSTYHFETIGMEKLHLLSKLDEPVRETVIETVDVENATVKELRNEINRITSENADLGQKLDAAQESLASKDKQFKEAMEAKDKQLKAAKESGEQSLSECKTFLNGKIRELEARIQELQDQPITHDMTDADLAAEIKRLQRELEDEQLKSMMLEKSAESRANRAADAVRQEYEKKLAEVQASERESAPDTKDVFKAYLANAADSMSRLLTYLESIREDKNLPLYVSKVDGIVEMTQTRRNAL